MPIDDSVEEFIKEDNAQAEAVRELLNVADRKQGKPSQVELKTDLSEDDVRVHSVLNVLNDFLENSFKGHCILGDLIERKERKSLSKNRLSRQEIVQVAKPAEMNFENPQMQNEGFIRRWFTPRKPMQQ